MALNFQIHKTSGTYNSVKGHSIAFPDYGPEICSSMMPDLTFTERQVFVSLQGPDNVVNNVRLDTILSNMGAIRVNSEYIIDWLYFFHFMNPNYYDISIQEDSILL